MKKLPIQPWTFSDGAIRFRTFPDLISFTPTEWTYQFTVERRVTILGFISFWKKKVASHIFTLPRLGVALDVDEMAKLAHVVFLRQTNR